MPSWVQPSPESPVLTWPPVPQRPPTWPTAQQFSQPHHPVAAPPVTQWQQRTGPPCSSAPVPSPLAAQQAGSLRALLPGPSPQAVPPKPLEAPLQFRGVKVTLELMAGAFCHIIFLVRSSPRMPPDLLKELLSWPAACRRDDGVSFPTKDFNCVCQQLKELAAKSYLELDLLPDWVCKVAGFGREEVAPACGFPLPEAERRVTQFLDTLPQDLRERSPVLPYQLQGIAFGLHRGGRVLFGDEMGLGKTLQALLLAAQFQQEWPVLVIAPSSLRFVWRDQAAQWLPHLVGAEGEGVHVMRSSKDVPPARARVVVGTYDLVRRNAVLRARADGRDYLVIIVDESQNIKERQSQRTKIVVGLCKSARRAILLSGTPALNRSSELYPQLEAILPSEMPHYSHFVDRYCIKETQRYGARVVEKYRGVKRQGELNALLRSSVMIRRLKKDVLEQLPEKRRMRVPLGPENMNEEILREVERRVQKMGDTAFTAGPDGDGTVVVRSLGDVANLFKLTADAKIGAVLEYVQHLLENGTKFLLFGHHQSTLDAVEKKVVELGIKSIRIDGHTPVGQRPLRVTQFQEDEETKIAILSITAAGTGITLTAAQTVVFAELYWVPGLMQQAEDRAHRIGQRDSVTVQYLIAKGTLDDILYRTLEKKSLNTSAMLDGSSRGLNAERETLEEASIRVTAPCHQMAPPCGNSVENPLPNAGLPLSQPQRKHDQLMEMSPVPSERSLCSPLSGTRKRPCPTPLSPARALKVPLLMA